MLFGLERKYLWLSAVILLLAALAIFLMGHVLICKCGYVKLWHGVPVSSENSQHLTDWYTLSHIIHGFAFYGLYFLLRKRFPSLPAGLGLALAVLVESGWEIFENTDFIINRYREQTISLDYYGDSVINSVMDILAMVGGYFVAMRSPWWLPVGLTILMEGVTGYFIRDNLILNIVMLLYPLEAVKTWQAGG